MEQNLHQQSLIPASENLKSISFTNEDQMQNFIRTNFIVTNQAIIPYQ